MAGLSMKEIARIIEYVEPQGVTVTRTKKGLLLRLPDGKTEMVHFTNSDHRAFENQRARLHRAGIELPTDRHALKNLPDYITAGSMRKATLDRAQRVIDDLGSPRKITATEFMEAGGAPNHGLANRTLYHLGWLPQTDRKRAHKIWLQPLEHEEEPMTEEQLLERVERNVNMELVEWHGTRGSVAERIYTLLAAAGREGMATAELREALPDANPATVSSSLSNMKRSGLLGQPRFGIYALAAASDAVTAEPEQPEEPEEDQELAQDAPPVHTGIHGKIGDREFIDSVNSWVLDLAVLADDLTLGSIRGMLRSAALDFELRVWHENENV